MEPIGPNGQNDHLLFWSSRIVMSFLPNILMNLWSKLTLTDKMAHFHGQTIPDVGKPPILPIYLCYSSISLLVIQNFDVILAKKTSWTFVKTLAMEPIGPDGQNDLI
ncbi:hypothetical protein H5410_052976 [Solanum commersonii]|uniref:Uncharacterized protein n=1 Tax=Solanum commersonii TaxID=4109 RepID=A0A9J5X4M2_SOLCO|nr:hypothetical protein H5410_052976 [Solanum commersonii]